MNILRNATVIKFQYIKFNFNSFSACWDIFREFSVKNKPELKTQNKVILQVNNASNKLLILRSWLWLFHDISVINLTNWFDLIAFPLKPG